MGDGASCLYRKGIVRKPSGFIYEGLPQPLCGFSANAAGILASTGHDFAHVDVIADYEIREQIKQYSQWPTLPQIYVDKEFIGGSDILRQMSTDGSLQEMLNNEDDTATE